jgi:biotin carboxylase
MRNLLFVAGYGGPPLDFSLSAVKQHGRLHVLIPDSLAAGKAALAMEFADEYVRCPVQSEADLEAEIVRLVKERGIDAVVTLDEFSIAPVARAATRTGLRSSGANTLRSRNKWLMRQAFAEAGLGNPRFALVRSFDELAPAVEAVGTPAVLKLCDGAGSVGHTLIDFRDPASLERQWEAVLALIERVRSERTLGAVDSLIAPEFILESMIEASTDSWYDEDGFGDLVSVEGLVVEGVYHPIAITSKLPMVPPFTEVAQITPSPLAREKQERIMEYARRAVDSLGLETCGTHTEIKLQSNGGLCMVENAARLPGAVITKQVNDAFGVNLVSLLTRALLGEDVDMPPPQFDQVHSAAGPLGLVTVNSRFEPWTSRPPIRTGIDFSSYFPDSVEYQVRWSAHVDDGIEAPVYDPALGAMNYLGIFYFLAPDVKMLIHTQRTLMDRAEEIFRLHADLTAPAAAEPQPALAT